MITIHGFLVSSVVSKSICTVIHFIHIFVLNGIIALTYKSEEKSVLGDYF